MKNRVKVLLFCDILGITLAEIKTNKMKKTFRNHTILRNIKNVTQAKSLLAYAAASGVPVCDHEYDHEYDFNEYPCIWLYRGLLRSAGDEFHSGTNYEEINIAAFFEYCDNWVELNKPTVEIVLNNSYTAKITSEKVQVGCQEFSHEAIENLYKAVQSFK